MKTFTEFRELRESEGCNPKSFKELLILWVELETAKKLTVEEDSKFYAECLYWANNIGVGVANPIIYDVISLSTKESLC